MSALAVLTTVLRIVTSGAGAQRDIWHETVWVAWVLTLGRSRVIHFEAPRAVLVDGEHVDDCHDRVALEQWLPTISTLNRSLRHQLPLGGLLRRLGVQICCLQLRGELSRCR